MQGGLEFNLNDLVSYKNTASGTTFKGKVVRKFKGNVYELEIIECDKPHFVGQVKNIDFGAPHNYKRIEILGIEHFEEEFAKYQAALYFNYCLMAVDTNDKEWFNDSFAQYTLWKSQLRDQGEVENE